MNIFNIRTYTIRIPCITPLCQRCVAVLLVFSWSLQSCGSGLHAVVEEPAVGQGHQVPDNRVQASGAALSPGALAPPPSCTDARVSSMLGNASPVESAVPVVSMLAITPVPEAKSFFAGNLVAPSFVGPFTAYSGERVLLGQHRGRWQAVLQGGAGTMMHRRTLPVVSSGDIRASLTSLQGQGAWSSRSHIHVLATPMPPYSPCVYVGKLGLLGGAPTPQQEQQHGYKKQQAAEERAKLAEERAKLAEERAKLAEERAKLAEERAKLAEARADLVEGRAKSAEEKLVHLEKQVLLSQTATPAEAKLVSAVQAAEERARLAEEELAKLKHDYAEQLALSEHDQASVGVSYEDLSSKQRKSHKQSESALGEEVVCPAVQQAEKQALLSQTTLPSQAFGAKAWKKYFGEVGLEPCLPPDIGEILESACPFWTGKQVKDTHLLVLIPAKVNGNPFSLNLLGRLVQNPQGGGRPSEYRFYNSDVQAQFGARSPGCSYWVLMTRDVLEGSRRSTYASQQALVAVHASRTDLLYALPGVLEAVTVVLSHYVRSGERLYVDDPWTSTRCQELVAWCGKDHPAVIGSFSSGGLRVDCSGVGKSRYGVASLRKF